MSNFYFFSFFFWHLPKHPQLWLFSFGALVSVLTIHPIITISLEVACHLPCLIPILPTTVPCSTWQGARRVSPSLLTCDVGPSVQYISRQSIPRSGRKASEAKVRRSRSHMIVRQMKIQSETPGMQRIGALRTGAPPTSSGRQCAISLCLPYHLRPSVWVWNHSWGLR